MYINERRTFKAMIALIALLNMLICYVLCLVIFLLAMLSLSLLKGNKVAEMAKDV